MICVVIKGPTFEEAHEQILNVVVFADLVELRLDCFESLNHHALKALRAHFSIPMVFTLRSSNQGGSYKQEEDKRLSDIRQFAELKPDYLDLESHVPSSFIQELISQHPEIKLIVSHHNFTETPEDLDRLYVEMQQIPAFFYKIAVTAKNSLDALQFLCWAKKNSGKLIAISMGYHGQISRILGPIVGCPITYAALDDSQKSAPGQLSAKTLIERYHYHALNSRTAIYGLIGDPVEQSISDETHNDLIKVCGFNAVYVKIQVKASELPEFLKLAKQLPFHGLSVTMPLKESVLSCLDVIDASADKIGAVNTLILENGVISGFNTDGIGALNAIERVLPVKGKKIVIIGAGGAAKAIAYEAQKRGGLITIINRDENKALQIAQSLRCIGKGLDYMATCAERGYDILINCTAVSMPIDSNHLLSQAVVMDIKTKPKETEFLKIAMERECRVIYGYQMFIEQALGQFNLWFDKGFNPQECRGILEKSAEMAVHIPPSHTKP